MLLGVLACILTAAVPASAHSQLLGSDPADNAHLETAPSVVTLRFSAGVLTIGTAVVVADAAGTSWTEGAPSVSGQTVSTRLRGSPPDGAYQLRWRVVSADGHPISGVTRFTVGTARAEPGSATPSVSAAGPASPSPSASEPTSTPATNATAGGHPVRTVLVGAVGALAALALFLAYGAIRRRGAPDSANPPAPSDLSLSSSAHPSAAPGNSDDLR
ncbi:copper resistance CopC family protein [Parafrankia sp. FMc6]|uniref:copper resistance CopC family protein n=1 Tax=Parafrankia soli TaxID=2599596 RepID=UPI0034D5E51D